MKTRFKMGGVVNSDVEKAVALLAETDLGKVRGLLCNGCNTGLGNFKEVSYRLRDAADYLDKHNG